MYTDIHTNFHFYIVCLFPQACQRLNPSAPVRCISVLEGGYDLPALASSGDSFYLDVFHLSFAHSCLYILLHGAVI